MKKNTNWIKNFIFMLVLISITVQINLLLDFSIIKLIQHLQEKEKEEQAMLCPPDICTINEEKTADFEILNLPPLPPIK